MGKIHCLLPLSRGVEGYTFVYATWNSILFRSNVGNDFILEIYQIIYSLFLSYELTKQKSCLDFQRAPGTPERSRNGTVPQPVDTHALD